MQFVGSDFLFVVVSLVCYGGFQFGWRLPLEREKMEKGKEEEQRRDG